MVSRRSTLSFSLVAFLFAMTAGAATVRGRVVRQDGQPYGGATVAVENQAIGRSAAVPTTANGVFQLHNIPPGDYVMEVRTSGSTTTYRITVDQRQVVDVAPVTVR